jgi:hypothetical protein
MNELKTIFVGRGEVKGFTFRQVARSDFGYIYEVSQPGVDKPHYEAFCRRMNERFGVVSYPRSSSFGKWAFTYKTLAEAIDKLSEISNKEIMPKSCQKCRQGWQQVAI